MRISAFQAMIVLMLCGLLQVHEGFSQILDKQVTLRLRNVPFEQALQELSRVTSIKFAYSLDQLRVEEKVSIAVQDVPLRTVLDTLLMPFNIRYKAHSGASVISLKKQHNHSQSLVAVRPKDDLKIRVQIDGTVSDNHQQPMAGVSIIIIGTNHGTTSDADGRYSIHAEANQVLVFSFIGYSPVEIMCNGRIVIDVIMKEDISSLDEVVVNAGYYKTTRELQTGSIVRVEARDIETHPVSNFLAALPGRVMGFEAIQQNGIPGSNYKVRVRGTNSLSSGNDPLYIIDGVPYSAASMSLSETAGSILGNNEGSTGSSPLNSINPLDIESIEVLKDADATSIYGSRGANGVVLVTTKKGKEGKMNFDLNFYSGVAKVGHRMDLLRTAAYLEMRREALKNDGITPTPYDAADVVVWGQDRDTDWQRELIGDAASITDAHLSVSGGNQNTQFLVGGGFRRERTVFPGGGHDQRFSLLSSFVNKALDQKLVTSVSLNVSRNVTDMISKDLTPKALFLPPNAPNLYDDHGNLNWHGWTASMENPLAALKRRYESKTSNVVANVSISYLILEGLTVKMNMGLTRIYADAVTLNPVSSYHPAQTDQVNQSMFGDNRFENWVIEPQLNWTARVGRGTLDVLAGATFLDQNTAGVARYAEGFTSEALMKNPAAAPTIGISSMFHSDYRYQAFFGRVNYTLRKKYVLNLTGRRDGSSRFGPGNQFAMFGAVGSAWIFSREAFIARALPFLSFGKLKISYGTTGNDQIGDYQYVKAYAQTGVYHDQQGLGPSRLYNPDFAWEVNRKFEISLDLGIMNDRVMLTANLYRNRSSSQLVGLPLAPTTGFSFVQENFPAIVQNTGVEFDITAVNVQSESGFEWVTSLNVTIPRNKLLAFPRIQSSPAYAERYTVGEPLDIVRLYGYRGVDPASGEYNFTDVNDDGQHNINDRQYIRFVGRHAYGGLHNSLRFAGFQLDFLLQLVGQDGYNAIHIFSRAPGMFSNQPDFVMKRWIGPDQSGHNQQRFTTGGTNAEDAYTNYLYYSTAAVSNASFVRLKNLSLSYSLRKLAHERLQVQDVTVFVHGQNLITITNYNGLDPENPGSTSLPPLWTLTAGVRLKI